MSTLTLIYAAAAVTGILIAEAVYLVFAGRSDRRVAVNRRMRLQGEKKLSQQQVLVQLRKERGVDGGRLFSLNGLRRLRAQSGIVMPMPKFLAVTAGLALAAVLSAWALLGMPLRAGLAAWPALAVAVPVVTLRFLRARRHKMFGVQLPEALEFITRSLKAGHPVPVAVSMVAREMPDPIGTEFGLVADEVTYGSDLVSALHAMYGRVGHEDLPLFVTAVSIQSSSGGNLREILDGLSQVIRERGKLKRKIRAISTEGRMSAYILTAVPVLFGAGVTVLMPAFYADVMDEPMTWYLMGGSFCWLMLGNLMMFRMASFRF